MCTYVHTDTGADTDTQTHIHEGKAFSDLEYSSVEEYLCR